MTALQVVFETVPAIIGACSATGFVVGTLVVLFGEALAGLVHLVERWVK